MSRGYWIGLGALLLGAALLWWWFHTFERVTETVDLPPRGEARYNPLYALQQTLRAMDVDVRSRPSLNLAAMDLAPADVVVLGSDVRTLSEREVDQLLAWVAGGGDLLFALPRSDSERPGLLLTRLGLTLKESSECLRYRSAADAQPARLCGRYRAIPENERTPAWVWAWGDDAHGYALARATHGDGSWTLTSSLGFLSGRALRRDGHAALAWQLLGPLLGDGKVHLIYAVDMPPLHVLLVRQGWPVLLPLLLALLAWLWARSQRFGPMQPLPPSRRRALLEHIDASAEFALRRGQGRALYQTLRRGLLARLQREHPALAALDGEDLVRGLAQAWQRDPALVRAALFPAALDRPEQFLAAVQNLNRLRAQP